MSAEGQVVSAAVPEVGAALVAVAGLLVLGLHHALHGGHGGQGNTAIKVTIFVSRLNLNFLAFLSLFNPFQDLILSLLIPDLVLKPRVSPALLDR